MKHLFTAMLRAGLCATLVFSLLVAVAGKPAVAAEPIKIGTIFSITGWAGFIGTPQKEVFAAMIDDINSKGGIGGRSIEYYYEDDKSVPTNAVISATKLIKDRKVVAIVGSSTSDSALAMVPTCEQEQVSFINSGPAKIPFKKWIFSVGPGDVRCATHLIDYAVKDLGAKRIALFHGSDAYGMLGAKTITSEIGKYPGVSIIIQESLEPQDTNMIPQLTKIKAANPDLMILYTTGGAASVVAKNYKQLGMTTTVLGGNAITMPEFVKISGKIAEESKWIFLSQPLMIAEKMSPNDPYRKNVYEPFKKLMKEKYGPTKEVTLFHASEYDAVKAIIEAMKMAEKIEPASIRDALEKVKVDGFLGPFAPTSTDHQASPVDPMRPLIMRNGEWEPYTK